MTASASYRSHTQLWSDLLVALGGSEASLRRHLSERQFLFEILDVLGGSSTTLNLGGRASIMKAIVVAAGGSVSPNHVSFNVLLAQLVEALGGDPISPAYNSTAQLLAAAVNAVDTGGGGDTPEWVPANAKIYIDLVNVRAWTEADGEVAIDTLLGTDANTVNGWGSTEYNPSDLTADGLVYTTNPPAFLGAARSKVLDAATVQVKFKCLDNSISNSFAATAANGADAVEIDLISATSEFQFESWGGAVSEEKLNVVNSGNGAINMLAFTLTSARLEAALNGTDAITATLLDADRPAANPLVTALVDAGGSGHTALQSITIYDALPSTAGLSALSATG
jgi:hypothetical protein